MYERERLRAAALYNMLRDQESEPDLAKLLRVSEGALQMSLADLITEPWPGSVNKDVVELIDWAEVCERLEVRLLAGPAYY